MFARLVENWLTNASEREYQVPYCQVLTAQGYRVLHVSTHGPQEQGKDIIAVDPSGRPVGYQLKAGDIDLGVYRLIRGELVDLVEIPLQFPGVRPDGRHRCFLVTNGVVKDPVRQAILDQNRAWARRRLPRLEIVTRDELLAEFLAVHGAVFPQAPADLDELLRFYSRDGGAPLPKDDFSKFLLKNLPLRDLPKRRGGYTLSAKRPHVPPRELGRRLGSVALLVAYALRAVERKGNHWAVFEAWVMLAAHILAVSERFRAQEDQWRETFDLAFLAAYRALEALIEETLGRERLLEGDILVDSPVYRARLTVLMGLMSAYHIINRLRGKTNEYAERIRKFVDKHRNAVQIWGESALPYMVLLGFYFETSGPPMYGEALWSELLKVVTMCNQPVDKRRQSPPALADPYVACEDALARGMGIKQEPSWDQTAYDGQAYSLRALVLLLARRLRRRTLASVWQYITHVDFLEMYPRPKWGVYLWRSPTGELKRSLPGQPQSWAALLDEARNVSRTDLPGTLAKRPDFLAAFLCVYPQRLRTDTLTLLDNSLS